MLLVVVVVVTVVDEMEGEANCSCILFIHLNSYKENILNEHISGFLRPKLFMA